MQRGMSLALIRPRNTRFNYRLKKPGEVDAEREAYRRAARQASWLDKELAELQPSPYRFMFRFEDAGGTHLYTNGDWEAYAMFYRERNRAGEAAALRWMDHKFNEEFPARGMVFAIGNQMKRPRTWQLLGVIRMDEASQIEMPL